MTLARATEGYRERVEVGAERDRVLRALDVSAVLVLFALTVVGIFVDVSGPSRWLVAPVFGAGITLPLLARRRAPLGVVCMVTGAAVLNASINGLSAGGAGTWFAWVFAAYAVGGHWDGRRAVIGGLVVAAPTVVIGVLKMSDGEDASALLSPRRRPSGSDLASPGSCTTSLLMA